MRMVIDTNIVVSSSDILHANRPQDDIAADDID